MKWLLKMVLKRSNWSIPYFIFLLGFVVLPLILICIYAFQNDAGSFTLDNFSKFISNPEAANTFVYSIGKCQVCPKYNGCLLQMIYTSLIETNEKINMLVNNQNLIADVVIKMQSNNNVVLDDSVDLSLDVSEINTKLDNLTKTIEETNDSINELMIDASEIKSSLTTLDLKLDDVFVDEYVEGEGQ